MRSWIGSLLLKSKVKRNDVGNQVRRLRVMSIAYFQHIQTRQYAFWRRDADTRAEELAGKSGKRIIAGVIFIRCRMLFVSRKIIHRPLHIVSVIRR